MAHSTSYRSIDNEYSKYFQKYEENINLPASTMTILRGFLLGISLAVLISLLIVTCLYGLMRGMQKLGYLRKFGYRKWGELARLKAGLRSFFCHFRPTLGRLDHFRLIPSFFEKNWPLDDTFFLSISFLKTGKTE